MKTDGIASDSNILNGKEYLVAVGVVLLGLFMSVMDTVIVNIALPSITAYFGNTISESQWVVTAYLITITAFMIVFGKLSTYTGLKKMFLGGIALFTVSSLGCGMASSLLMLITFRITQAIGGAMASSISMALIYRISPPDKQGKAIGIMGATVAIASLAGPGIGGILIEMFDWRAIFHINIPIGIIGLFIGIPYLKVTDTKKKGENIDWIGAVSFAVGITSLMVLFNAITTKGLYSMEVLVTFTVMFFAFMLLGWNERRQIDPMLDTGVFREPMFFLPLLSTILFFAAVFMLNITMPFYLEEVLEFTPLHVGMLMMAIPVVLIVGSPIVGWLYDHYLWQHFSTMGLLVAFSALLICAWAILDERLGIILFSMGLFAAGYSLFQSPNNIEIMRGLHKDRAAIASSIANTGRYFGMAIGASFASVILSIQFLSTELTKALPEIDINSLTLSSGVTLAIAALLCIIAAWPSYIRNRNN
ncbi:TPA: MFS transporter [Methanosarcina acetivorans]|uniref:Multidrug resistance protein n=2 Tax=Methanosarcina acetivorans TaxID=2214 RepID=Q8TH99_METAC|nr:MFS transporter [Methanosarcina acetivorans]AAM07957.1 multidrug resistance protein [Methanosarcina acetivorans C2A]HIH92982.1 MFS transporter [Methanosarcina acetivorans]